MFISGNICTLIGHLQTQIKRLQIYYSRHVPNELCNLTLIDRGERDPFWRNYNRLLNLHLESAVVLRR